jgi:hypothetical protein
MKRILLVVVLMLSALMISDPPAFAGSPYSGGGGQNAALAPPTTTCLDRLDTNSYSCHVKSSFGGDFTDTLSFSGGTLTPAILGFSTVCSCGTGGTFNTPKFGHSKGKWQCIGTDGFLAIEFQGTVGAKGKLTKVTAVNNDPGTFVITCTGP